ncbi:VIT family-domain-containing protein [Hypoxylon sp. FL0890]|nr:VIT family-domain-containing protein [Hypoxylon sp. FL0890]
MHIGDIQAFFARLRHQDEHIQESLPYSALPTDPIDPVSDSMNADGACEDPSFDDRRTDQQREESLGRLSSLLSNFTLGFADGLTVPFALTAGLSSLGETRTVIYAGAAEICAGCISMGIGGYLAAKGETATKANAHEHSDELGAAEQDSVQEYLAPLDLPPDLLQSVKAHIDCNPVISERLRSNTDSAKGSLTEKPRAFSPAILGLSVSFGYMVGGLLPLFPYFFVSRVEDGLKWSFAVCILALFVFGFSKEYLLNGGSLEGSWSHLEGREVAKWERVKRGFWEGMRMVIMGGIAAIAAVFCVKLFDDVMP